MKTSTQLLHKKYVAKPVLILLMLLLPFIKSHAQWVTIPDPYFVTQLQQLFPSCMNGNQMNTSCAQIVNAISLNLSGSGISNLSGIEYFVNLQTLQCQYNNLTSLTTLPNSLTSLVCPHNQLTSISSLPNSLTSLSCFNNQLSSLPALPNSLTFLGCDDNQLSSLPVLPNSLNYLYCYQNQLTSLPTLPSSLIGLRCYDNQLSSLPALPNSLTELHCYNNQLSSLPALPNSLTELHCYNNQLSSLPALPNSLTELRCNSNHLSSLPALPNSLTVLYCHSNQLSSLPALPNSLTHLYCYGNQLSSLPILPNSLTILFCYFNQLNSLPALPNSLIELWCYTNQLSSLPALPNSLTVLLCYNNQLSSLPALPNTMTFIKIQNNNISCLVNLPQVSNPNNANISNNPLTCVPNQTNYTGNLPLCIENDTVNNPNNCPGVNITGSVFRDLNNNCQYNTTDLHIQNLPVKLFDNQNNFLAQSYTINGVYSFNTLLPDTYQVKIDTTNFPIGLACGQNSTQSVTLNTPNQSIQNINFPVVCNAPYDVWVQSVNTNGWVFPGQVYTIRTNITNNSDWYNLNCTSTTVSGTVIIQVNGPVSYVAPAAGALIPTVNGNTFTYTISDFSNLNGYSFGLKLMTDTIAQAGNPICVHVEINPNPLDANTTNNVYDFCYNVVNSYDPNIKQVYPQNVLPGYDDWFTYTIYFQNTGNAPAFNIRLRDTLDTQLDLNTFEVRGYSHPAAVNLNGNILTVRYNNIMLPDSTSNPEGSIGYFQYRLKTLPGLPNGSQIRNTCYIYFDFNAPIITNTTENNFDITVKAPSIKTKPESFDIFPNPSSGLYFFRESKNVKTVEVFNMLGEQVLTIGNTTQINLSSFPQGIYMARINGQKVMKLVKE